MPTSTISLRERYEDAKKQNPKLRIRDHAKQLGVSEAELLATGIGSHVTLLEGNFKEFLKEVNTLGRVMALTRNDDCVHERKGVYNKVSFKDDTGLVLDPEIDLRLFMQNWKYGFAVAENERLSFQFFDKSGEAVHKIYITEQSDRSGYFRLLALYKARDQHQEIITEPYPPASVEIPDNDIDIQGFQAAWKNMTDTHQFFGILKKYSVNRRQGFRLAPEGFVHEVPNDTVVKLLENCSVAQVPVMIFVGNRGCIQIHSGPVNKLLRTGPWYNILDPELNLHLKTESIANSFIVKKPTEDGTVTSLEIMDDKGNLIVQFFGKRKPGIPENAEWTATIKSVTGY